MFEIISQPLYVLMFGLASYGLYSVLWAAITLIQSIADLAMPAALQRVVPQAKSREAQAAALRAALIIGVSPSLAIAGFISIGAVMIAPLFNAGDQDRIILVKIIMIYAWSLPLSTFLEIATAALRSKRMFGSEIRLRLMWEQLIRLAITTALFFAGIGTEALFYAHVISLLITCVLSVLLLRGYFDLRLLFGSDAAEPVSWLMLKSGLAVWPGNIVARLFSDGPPLLLNALIPGATGAIATALYVIARKISSIVQLVRTAFNYVLAPLASAASQGQANEVRGVFGFVTRLSIALALPLGAVLGGGGPAILRLFGNEAEAALPALLILTVARIIEAVIGGAGAIQQVTGSFRSLLVGSLAGLAVAGLIVILVMPDGGVTGMALAIGVGVIIVATVPLYQLHIFDQLHPFEQPFFTVMIKSILISLVALSLSFLILLLPYPGQLPMLFIMLLAMLWIAARFALPADDRRTLGKTARILRLI